MTTSALDLRIARCRDEAVGIRSLELVDPSGRPLPAFTPGAHVDVALPGGLVRQYSLCNPPGETHRYRIAVLREPASRGGSAAVHALCEGETLRVGSPRNHFPLAEDAGPHLLLAGGIGITPMLSMAYGLAQRGASFTLHYSVRSKERAAFVEEITAAFPAQARLHFDDSIDSALSLQAMLDGFAPTTHLYVCGPTGYIDWVLGAARAAGWPELRLHREYFSAPAAPAGGPVAEAFEVQIRSSGLVVPVPAGRSVVEVLRDRGIELPVSCEQGICGTCVVGIVDGTPDHRDMFLTPSEQAAGDRFTPCCSRARTPRLVLDL